VTFEDVIGAGRPHGGWPGAWREFCMARLGDDTVLAFVASSDTSVGQLHGYLHVRG
jgi:hypothetical protein